MKKLATCHRFKIFLITLIFSFLMLLLNFLPGEERNIIIWILQSSFDFLYTWSWCLKIAKIQISPQSITVQHKIHWITAGTMHNMQEHIVTFWTECNILRKHYSACQQQVFNPLMCIIFVHSIVISWKVQILKAVQDLATKWCQELFSHSQSFKQTYQL